MLALHRMPELHRLHRPAMGHRQRIRDKRRCRPQLGAGRLVEARNDDSARKGCCLPGMGCTGPITRNA